ncbi:MAG: hypothetical protein K2W85_13540 [Phycisphaerales bacterium]|nr:hypothetical protein [Phycisphaerales bacterium]
MKLLPNLLMVSVFAALPSIALGSEVVSNGGFESAGTGGATQSLNWNTASSGGPGSLSERSATMPRSGGFSHHIVTFGQAAIGGNSSASQNSAANAIALQQNTTLSASFYGKYTFTPGGVGFYVLRVLNSSGGIVAQTPLGVISNGTGGAYQNFNIGPINVPAFGAPPNDAYYAFIELNVAAGAFVGSSAEAHIDDVSINGTILGGAVTGACCVGTVCSSVTQAACTGTYQGDNTTCSPDPCAPPVTGACCAPAGTCSVTTQAACTDNYLGNSTSCTPNTCPVVTDIATNGGFETAGLGGPTESFAWTVAVSGGPGSLSERDSTMPRTGGFAHHLLTFGQEAIGGNAAVQQNTTSDGGLPSLQENTPVTLSYRGKYNLGPGGVGFYVLRILNAGGAIVAATPLGVINTGTSGQYQAFTSQTLTVPAFGAPPNDVYSAFVEINVAAGAFVGASAEAFIDDVRITGTLASTTTTGVCCRGATCNATIALAACTTSGTQWGASFSTSASACSSTSATSPCCYADYDKTAGIQTADIFAFLNDWFASSPFATVGGDGTTTPGTPDIFAFLNAWFAGGC